MKLLKRVSALLLTFLMLLSLMPVSAFAAEGKVVVEAGSAAGKPGDTVDVTIKLTENPGIIGLNIRIGFDDTVLEIVDKGTNEDKKEFLNPASKNPFGCGELFQGESYNKNPISYLWMDPLGTENVTKTGDLMTITFQIKNDAEPGSTPITVEFKEEPIDYNTQKVDYAAVNGFVTIDGHEHDWSDPTYSWSEGHEKNTAKRSCTCGAEETETATATITEDNEAGTKTYEAVFKNPAFKPQKFEETLTLDPTIMLSSASAYAGETVDVAVKLMNNPGIVALELLVDYDNDVLELTGVQDKKLIDGYTGSKTLDVKPYYLSWLQRDSNNGNGKLAVLTFKVKDDAVAGESKVSVNVTEAFDADEKNVEFETSDGVVTVKTHSDTSNDIIRLSGESRIETARTIAAELKLATDTEKFNTILYASGKNFPDALTGSYLAAKLNAPTLLHYGYSSNVLETNLKFIQDNLQPGGTVYILGGESAVPEEVEEYLIAEDINVMRLKGTNRFDTNIEILKEAGFSGGETVLVCRGCDYPDSLSASATGMPLLLVNERTGVLTDNQIQYLNSVRTCNFVIIGGSAAVGDDIQEALVAYDADGVVERLSGNTRYETSILVASRFVSSAEHAVVASGEAFPDALCGGVLAYKLGAPMILTANKKVDVAAAYLAEKNIMDGYVLGGSARIDDAAARTIFRMQDDDEIIVKELD